MLTENEVLVGAPGAGRGLGRVYRFVMDADGNVTEATKLGTAALGFGAGFAASLAGDGSLLVAGSPGDDLGAGTATIMDRSLGGFDRTKVFQRGERPRSRGRWGDRVLRRNGRHVPLRQVRLDLVPAESPHGRGPWRLGQRCVGLDRPRDWA